MTGAPPEPFNNLTAPTRGIGRVARSQTAGHKGTTRPGVGAVEGSGGLFISPVVMLNDNLGTVRAGETSPKQSSGCIDVLGAKGGTRSPANTETTNLSQGFHAEGQVGALHLARPDRTARSKYSALSALQKRSPNRRTGRSQNSTADESQVPARSRGRTRLVDSKGRSHCGYVSYRQEAIDLLESVAPPSAARDSLRDLVIFVTERVK